MRPAAATRPVTPPASWAEQMFCFGVTGTNGKTSTTHLLAAAVAAAGHSTLRVGTVGVQLDGEALPRGKSFQDFLATMELAANRGCRHAVLEATSRALAQGYARAWRFDLGVFTNLSPDHTSTHKTWEHYLAAKAQLFVHLGPGRTAVLNAADPFALFIDQAMPADVVRRYFAAPSRGAKQCPADLEAARVEVTATGTRVQLVASPLAEQLGGELRTRMVGEVFGENALAAALAGLAAGLPGTAVVRGIADCPVVPGRFEVLDLAGRTQGPVVAVDYAHTPDALEHTCATARKLAGAKGRVIVVFGAGGGASPDKREPMGAIVGAGAELAIVTNDNPRNEDPQAIANMLLVGLRRARARVIVELDRARAIELALHEAGPGDVVVVAGKGHETGQVVRGRTLPFSDLEQLQRLLA
ncbi:UDP-N-acetylmuramoylalanyl-D-glutamate--2,6-diaminopimelate ligase [Enhygromyxa salina]|uniref:UDP-N-acetylmuramoylalanyl-D-glutamate--2, 6-diaminopimelate ligase n=1 Tax=Enhygromyxa salina TaxID=215803 RepID=A0A0C2CVF7_9BACT|nr:UDP-N-acetylmuramoyl-L-alanyl-D-glutamate--2,6-diaminopimelate ligase [Enhygromyxa salina]KIG13580.1 UDP-N-acetylmuramoylalanyl-D-glutamate--2,6-diaminopimelate ligase [Enhygromyxa salina]